jgi:myo-inositol-1(or 4)-monophosphatase
MAMSPLLDDLIDAARLAGAIQRDNFRSNLAVTDKNGGKGTVDLVSRVDHECEQAIRIRLAKHKVVGEEQGGEATGTYVLVDPLDGTKNYLLGVEQFAVCLTYIENGKVTAAVVYDPIRDRAYAADDNGATMNGQPIAITQSEPRGTYLVTEENLAKRGPLNRILRVAAKFAGVRKFGSTALDLAQMAAGQSCAVVATGLKPWDFQGAAFIYEKAGGKISDLDGRPITMGSTTLVACPPKMHENLVWA